MKGVLYLVYMALWVSRVASTSADFGPGMQEKLASADDVNVLMYGVLQFSEVLHNTYQNTESKVDRIATALRHQEGELAQLEKEAKKATHTEELIRHSLEELQGDASESVRQLRDSPVQTQMAGLQSQATQLSGALSKAEQEEAELQDQVTTLETHLQRTAPGKIRALKEQALQNSGALNILAKWIQDQNQTLEEQNQHLTQLQGMMHKSTPKTESSPQSLNK